MTTPRGLMGVGMPAQLAKRIGFDSTPTGSALTAAGTTQATAQAIGQFQFYVRPLATSSAYGVILPSNAEQGSEYMVMPTTATIVLWPPVGGQLFIAAGVTATGISLAIGKGACLFAVTASLFDVWLNA